MGQEEASPGTPASAFMSSPAGSSRPKLMEHVTLRSLQPHVSPLSCLLLRVCASPPGFLMTLSDGLSTLFSKELFVTPSPSPSHETLLLSSIILSLQVTFYTFPRFLSHELNQSTFSYSFLLIQVFQTMNFLFQLDFLLTSNLF